MTNLDDAIREMKSQFSKAGRIVRDKCPEYETEFQTYCNEALMARKELQHSLKILQPGASILEIGAGILALSFQLAREGFHVTSVEPVGSGFGPIEKLMKCIEEQAKSEGLHIKLIRKGIEEISYEEKYDFAFSINVMEHLENPYNILENVPQLLKENSCYRFICPNYNFPYEPHFSKFIFQRRNNSFFLSEKRMRNFDECQVEAKGLYESINFITLRAVRKAARKSGLLLKVNRQATFNLFERALNDPILRNRHRVFSYMINVISFCRLHKLISFVPAGMQPVMDVEVHNPE